VRLFVAIELEEAVRSALAKVQADLKGRCDGVRWIPSHQLHMTVKFLGEVPDRDVTKVSEAVNSAASKATAFALEISGCGCFPPRGLVRIVWVGANEPTGKLLSCVEAVEGELEAVGFARERRRFSPHLTIGRVRDDRSGGQIRTAVEAHTYSSLDQTVRSMTLMSSVLSPKGPTYTPVTVASLGKSSPSGE
jgi:2'-5' RNA ligase